VLAGVEQAQHDLDLGLSEGDGSADAFEVNSGEGRGFPGLIGSLRHDPV